MIPAPYPASSFNHSLLSALILAIIISFSACTSPGRFEEEHEENNDANPRFDKPVDDSKPDIKKDERLELTSNISVRVLIAEQESFVELFLPPCKILAKDEIIFSTEEPLSIRFGNTQGIIRFKVGGNSFSASMVDIVPTNQNLLRYKKTEYRGAFRLYPSNRNVALVNTVDLESYVCGVVPREMGMGWAGKVTPAQEVAAICARSYALYKKNLNHPYFDLYQDTRDQVYGGATAENPSDNEAVHRTFGMVLTYKEEPIAALYHSSCGGFTEDGPAVYGKNRFEYLQGVQDGDPPNCSGARNFEWKESFTAETVTKTLKNNNLIPSKAENIKEFSVEETFTSGRVRKVRVTYEETGTVIVNGSKIRSIFKQRSGEMLRSSFFTLDSETNEGYISIVKFSGKGYGHGLGLCQHGAMKLSRDGTPAEEILKFYYPKTDLIQLYE